MVINKSKKRGIKMCDWRVEGFVGMNAGDWLLMALDEDFRGCDIYQILYCCEEYHQNGDYQWFKAYYYKTPGEKEYNDPHTEFLIYLDRGLEMMVRTKDDKRFKIDFEDWNVRKIIDSNKKEEGV